MPPIRFNDSPESVNTHSKKRKTTPDIKNKSQRNREDIKEDCTSDGDGGLSAYELERLENIRQNQAFLSSMNIFQAMEELKPFTRPKPSQRGLMSSFNLLLKYSSLKHPAGPLPMNPVNMEQGSKLPSQLLELCSEDSTTERKMDLKLKEYCSALKNMRITEDTVAKVVKERVFSAAFHPCTSSLLMATGDMGGHLGLWKLVRFFSSVLKYIIHLYVINGGQEVVPRSPGKI
ncbi:WD repeat-containing protein 76 [Dissostichus eleginoides]|uniref:WD repeat-containing protein 76 n=1 Tax=Dissostichus eleginoides TaxID=100907 RepID=A0AAD9C046_DISEL|nr:WD repeat-containing protein 76 [Dissostichus eleginoides]